MRLLTAIGAGIVALMVAALLPQSATGDTTFSAGVAPSFGLGGSSQQVPSPLRAYVFNAKSDRSITKIHYDSNTRPNTILTLEQDSRGHFMRGHFMRYGRRDITVVYTIGSRQSHRDIDYPACGREIVSGIGRSLS